MAGAASILGVRVACLDRAGLMAEVGHLLDAGEAGAPAVIGYANAHCLNLAQLDEMYRRSLQAFDLIYADGVGVVWAARLLGACRLHKLTGADWVEEVFGQLAARRCRVFLLAGEPGGAGGPGVAAQAASSLARRYPGLVVAGSADGFFAEKTEAEVLAEIRAAAPDVLFVGMGVPRQEKWIEAHRHELPVKICWAVGALFDYTAGVERRAPRWMLRLGLEWLFRLREDPAGKWQRYLIGNPLFLWRVLASRCRNNF